MSVLDRIKKSREDIKYEYDVATMNPIVKSIIQSVVMVIDLVIMFVLIWNMFSLCIPNGSWFNIVEGVSMEPTMHSRQIVYTDMAAYGRGDIVTSYMPQTAIEMNPSYEGKLIIKRIVG